MVKHFPEIGYRSTSHARLTPNDRSHLDDGLISTAWNAGTLHVQYVGLPTVAESAVKKVGETMWRFAADCQVMVVLYAGVLRSRGTIQAQLGGDKDRKKPFAVTTNDRDGNVTGVWAWLPRGQVFDAFSSGGEFEQTFAKAFVVFAYQRWEEFARPQIAQALRTKPGNVRCNLMGEWRYLRNWLVHPDEKTEADYFKNADLLAKIPASPRPGRPGLRSGMVFFMMGHLNCLHAVVNPDGLEPGIELSAIDAAAREQMAAQAEPGQIVEPIWKGFGPPAAPDGSGSKTGQR